MFRSILVTLLAAAGALSAADGKKPVTIDAVMHAERWTGEDITWSPKGDQFVLKNDRKLLIYKVKSGKSHEAIDLGKLEDAAEKPPTPPVTDWTNRRVSETSLQWFPDGRRLLVAESGDLFLVDTLKSSFEQLTHTADVERDPKLSPDGRTISFRKGPNLYDLDLESKAVRQLTSDGSETLLNGQLDWVYPEELDLQTAHWWSPDSKSIAYLQFDVSHEPVFPQVSLLKARGVLEPERYPKAGDPNAEVRLGIVPAQGGETRWMNLGEPRDNLLARATWLPDSHQIAAVKLNRIQNKLDLYVADAHTGAARPILHEESQTWINLAKADGSGSAGEPIFLKDGTQFLWTSERDGFRHLYLYGSDGAMKKQLTSGNWEIEEIAGVDRDHNRVFFTSTEASPLERQLYVIGLNGEGKRRLTEGKGTHQISLAPDCSTFLDSFSNLATPWSSTLYNADGDKLREFHAAATKDKDEYDLLPTEITTVKAADGTELYARMIKPAGFTAGRKYPAIVMIYGGPGAQSVRDSWTGLSLDQVLAHQGFVIWQLDNRGSANRGHQFEAPLFHHLGEHELEDQKVGINHLVSLGFVDPQRLGMFGWSYGGFMTLNTVVNAPGLIKAAVAGAPVTSWRNYDSIYTERYMGLPEDNNAAYKSTSPQEHAADLQSKLLIVHNVEDDNVHFANTLQMADALEKADKPFYIVTYPQRSHGVGGPVRRHLYTEIANFFEQNLR